MIHQLGNPRPDQPGRPPLVPITETPKQRQQRERASRGALVRSGRTVRKTDEETTRDKRAQCRLISLRNAGPTPAQIGDLVADYLHSTTNIPRTANAFRESLGISPRIGGILEADGRFQLGQDTIGHARTYQLTVAAVLA